MFKRKNYSTITFILCSIFLYSPVFNQNINEPIKGDSLNKLSFINYTHLFYLDNTIIYMNTGYFHLLNLADKSIQFTISNESYYSDYHTNEYLTSVPLMMGTNQIYVNLNIGRVIFSYYNTANENDYYLNNTGPFFIGHDISAFFQNLSSWYVSDTDKIGSIIYFFIENYEYDFNEKDNVQATNEWRLPQLRSVYENQKGICYDISALLVAVLRDHNIPAKLVEGYLNYNKDFHAWAEIYVDGQWVSLDITYGILTKNIDFVIDHSNISSIVRVY